MRSAGFLVPAAGLLLVAGCATNPLGGARSDFARRDYDAAAARLEARSDASGSTVLFLMERGMVQQARGHYEESVRDWLEAADLIDELDHYSLSRDTGSFVMNDRVQSFRGAPFERSLLHAFCAKSYLAMGFWDDAAVEARRLIRRQESLDGYPDDAYTHYVAGLCLELAGDGQAAAIEYRRAGSLAPGLHVSDSTGRLAPASTNEPGLVKKMEERTSGSELICLVGIGSAPPAETGGVSYAPNGSAAYAEIHVGGLLAGRSYTLADTARLRAATARRDAAKETAKTITRIALKEAVSSQVEEQNEELGMLLRFLLFALEVPDDRAWRTLPRQLQVARVPCPPDLQEYRIVVRGADGGVVEERTVRSPIARRYGKLVSFCRIP